MNTLQKVILTRPTCESCPCWDCGEYDGIPINPVASDSTIGFCLDADARKAVRDPEGDYGMAFPRTYSNEVCSHHPGWPEYASRYGAAMEAEQYVRITRLDPSGPIRSSGADNPPA